MRKNHQTTPKLSLPSLTSSPSKKFSSSHNNPPSHPQSHPSSLPLKQYHKINWSISPNCLLQSHQGYPIIYICMHSQCQHITRLICQKCFYGQHKEHNKYCMAIDEIKVGKIKGMRYWPFSVQDKKMFQFVKTHHQYVENLIADIKSTFDNLQNVLIDKLKQTQQQLLIQMEEFYKKNTRKYQYITEIQHKLQKYYNIKGIQTNVRQIFNKQIRHDIFTKKMNAILTDKTYEHELGKLRKQFCGESQLENKGNEKNKEQDEKEGKEVKDTKGNEKKQEFKNKSQGKGRDMQFDRIYFLKKQKIIMKNIQQLNKSVVEKQVTIDQATVGLQKIIVQTVEYLKKSSQGLYPLSYDEKQLQDGTYYNGFMCKGYRTLLGLRDYKNGYIYYGQWKNNCRNGWGVYQNKENGYRYAGMWKQDKKSGFGKQITPVYVYEGDFVNDKKQGFGSIRQDGIRFDITWKNDKKNGKGKRFDSNGENQVYFLNGIESQVKGGNSLSQNGQGQKRDVNFLARMFANQQSS